MIPQVYTFRDSLPSSFTAEYVVLVDTHNFTTTVIEALSNGATAVFPLAGGDNTPSHVTLIAGDSEEPLSNHPEEMTPDTVVGEVVGINSHNGSSATHTIRANGDYSQLLLGSFINGRELGKFLTSNEGETVFVIAGNAGNASPEDVLTVMYILENMRNSAEDEVDKRFQFLYDVFVVGLYNLVYDSPSELGPYGRPSKHARSAARKFSTRDIIPTYSSEGFVPLKD